MMLFWKRDLSEGLEGMLAGIVGPKNSMEDEAPSTFLTLYSVSHSLESLPLTQMFSLEMPATPLLLTDLTIYRVGTVSLALPLLTQHGPLSPPTWTAQVSQMVLPGTAFPPAQVLHRGLIYYLCYIIYVIICIKQHS